MRALTMRDPFRVVEYHCVSSFLEHVKRETVEVGLLFKLSIS